MVELLVAGTGETSALGPGQSDRPAPRKAAYWGEAVAPLRGHFFEPARLAVPGLGAVTLFPETKTGPSRETIL